MVQSSAIGKCVVWLFCLICTCAFCQTGVIRGRVLDAATREPLPFSNVFISNTTLGASSDSEGNFTIRDVPLPGVYEVIASFVGYESFTVKINIADSLLSLRPIYLKASEVVLNSIEVKSTRDKAWEKKFKKFSEIFLGSDKQAEKCTITNPWVVDFPPGANRAEFVAKASEPIEIENKALGYKVKFYLVDFAVTATDYRISGRSFFSDLEPANPAEREQWETERERSYHNSKQYLFRSIIEKQISGAGFRLYTEIQNVARSGFFYNDLGKIVTPCDTMTLVENGPGKDIFRIKVKGPLEVHYTGEKDKSSIYRDVLHPVSRIVMKNGSILVNKDGFEMNLSETSTEGSMSNLRVSRLVPYNYRPPMRAKDYVLPEPPDDFGFMEEKVYAQTDKPYYYPGETAWFKGYIRYRTPSLKDSLSGTAYAELIGPGKDVVKTMILEVSNGSFYGQFDLPGAITAGDYYLRCYTNLNRNFDGSNLFMKYIPVAPRQTVDRSGIDTTTVDNGIIGIHTAKMKFHKREKIDITLSAQVGDPLLSGTDLSIAVTDLKQVAPVNLNRTIVDELELRNSSTPSKIEYPVEYGFGFKGNFHDDKAAMKERLLAVVQLRPPFYTMAATDKGGNFEVNGLYFYDSAYFKFVPKGERNSNGVTTIFPHEAPPVTLPDMRQQIAVRETGELQRAPLYKTDTVTVLDEVTIRASGILNENFVTQYYGRSDVVVSGDDLRKGGVSNLLMSLQGRVPGLEVRQYIVDGVPRWFVYIRSGKMSIPGEVRVAINGHLAIGTPELLLSNIETSTVVSVELIRPRGNDAFSYGTQVANGILSVYTNLDLRSPSETAKSIAIKGYQKPRSFSSPDHSIVKSNSGDDLRSTIYWNPKVMIDETGKAHVSFYAADLAGSYKIIVEGIAPNGTPIRAERTIEID